MHIEDNDEVLLDPVATLKNEIQSQMDEVKNAVDNLTIELRNRSKDLMNDPSPKHEKPLFTEEGMRETQKQIDEIKSNLIMIEFYDSISQ